MKQHPETTFIYALSHPDTGDVFYIGKSDDPKKRLRHHISESRTGDKNYARIRYIRALLNEGKKPILTVIQEVPFDQWEYFEKHYIAVFRTLGIDLVNSTKGGGVYPSWTGKHHSDETKKKMSNAQKGRPGKPLSLSHRETLSRVAKTTPRWNKGLIGAQGKRVYQYDLQGQYIGEYLSTGHAAKVTGIDQSTISRCCTGAIHRAKDFVFRYEFQPDGIAPFNYVHNVPVLQCDLQGNVLRRFGSLKEASFATGVKSSNISACFMGIQKTAGGFIWKKVAEVTE